MRRRVLPVTAVAALAFAGLTGCTVATTGSDACVAPLSPGALSESVTVGSLAGGEPDVSIDSGAEIVNAQRSVIDAASDRDVVAAEGTIVAANLAYFDSSSGEMLEASPSFGSGTAGELFLASAEGGPVLQGVLCSAPGDLVAIALPADLSAGAVTTPGASLVVLAEIVEVSPGSATGALTPLPSGFPAVVTDEAGRVGMVLPPQEAPANTKSGARIVGEGPEVQPDSMIIGNVLTVGWDGQQLKNTWEASPENLGSEEQIEQSGATFRAELTGYPVGSQVVVIEPGEGSPRVSVIDILAIA
ncbi:peptidylprolyl isomerase [Leucobacter sp. W1478]|uniref:peptidylprolyl isomerase n=1 Tax=Leucobacter sp. W1478 TaxID=3439065 RepID=UPI003F3BF8B5